MMHNYMYTILDVKVSSYQQPFYARSKGEAIRTLTSTLAKQDTILSQYPDDFRLYELGTFNDFDASFQLHDVPQLVGNLTEFMPILEVDSK